MDVTGFICRCWYVELFLKKILKYRFECHDYTWEFEMSLVDDTPGRIKVTVKRLSEEPVKSYHNSFVKSKEPLNDDSLFFTNENVTNKYIPSKCPLGKNTYDRLYNHKKQLEKLFLLSGTVRMKHTDSGLVNTTPQIDSQVDLFHNDKKKKLNKKEKTLPNKNHKNNTKVEEAWTISYFIRGTPQSHNDSDYSFVTRDAANCQSIYFEVDGGICCCNCGGYTYPILKIIQRTNFNELKNRLNNLSNSASTSMYRRMKRSLSSENELYNNNNKSKSELMTNWLQKNIYINRHTNMDEDDLQVFNYKSNNNGYNYYNYIYTSKIRNSQNAQNPSNKKERDLYKIISFDDNGVDRNKIINDAMKEYQKDVIRSKKKKEKENRLKKFVRNRILGKSENESSENKRNGRSIVDLFPKFEKTHFCFCHCHHFQRFKHDFYQKWEHRSVEFGYFGVFIHKNSKMKKGTGTNGKHKSNTPISNDFFYSVQIPKYNSDKKKEEDNLVNGLYKNRYDIQEEKANNEEEIDQFLIQDDNDYGDMTVIPCKKYYSLLKKNNLEEVVKDSYVRVITEKEMEKIIHEENMEKDTSNQKQESLSQKKSDSEESLIRVVKDCFNDSISSDEIRSMIRDNESSSSNSSDDEGNKSKLDLDRYDLYKNSSGSLFIKNNNNDEYHFKNEKIVERNRKNNIFYKEYKTIFNIKDRPRRPSKQQQEFKISRNTSSTSLSEEHHYDTSSSPSVNPHSRSHSRSRSRHLGRKQNSSIIDNFNSDSDLEEQINILKLCENEQMENRKESRKKFERERAKEYEKRRKEEEEVEEVEEEEEEKEERHRRLEKSLNRRHSPTKSYKGDDGSSHRRHHHRHHNSHPRNDNDDNSFHYIYDNELYSYRSRSPRRSMKSGHSGKKSHHFNQKSKRRGHSHSKKIMKTNDYKYDLANSIYC